MSAIESQISTAIGQATSLLGQPIVYTPIEGGSPASFLSVIEEVDSISTQSGSPILIEAERRNFLVQVSDYAAEPVLGDTISYDGDTYTVMIPEEKKAAWEWNDKWNIRRRVFTKRTG